MIRLWTACIACAALAGCAFEETKIRMPVPGDVATGSKRGGGREILLVGPVASGRPQARCGMRKNGYNVDVASILCEVAPELAITQLLQTELAAAGFKVLSDPTKAGPSAIAIGAVLEQAFLELKIDAFTATYETDIALLVRAQTKSGLLAERRFYVKGEEATYLGPTEDMERSWQSAARQLVAAVVGALANLADQFPAEPAP